MIALKAKYFTEIRKGVFSQSGDNKITFVNQNLKGTVSTNIFFWASCAVFNTDSCMIGYIFNRAFFVN